MDYYKLDLISEFLSVSDSYGDIGLIELTNNRSREPLGIGEKESERVY